MIPDVSVCILSYDGKDKLRQCLDSILKHTQRATIEILVTDNGSSDGTFDMVQREYRTVRLFRNEVNQKFTRPFNAMLAQATGRHFLILNNDVTFHDDAISSLSAYLDATPKVGAVTPASIEDDGSYERVAKRDVTFRDLLATWTLLGRLVQPASQVHGYDLTLPAVVDVGQDSCLMVRREVWEHIGAYDTRFKLYYTEDDICLRIRRAGWEIHYRPEVRIQHAHSFTTKRLPPLSVKWIYAVDMLSYARKHLGWARSNFLLAPLVALTFLLRLPRWAWERARR